MYNTVQKIGNIITVCGCRPIVGTSTTAAMLASLFAARGDKTLLITTDADIPYDAVSLLSGDIEGNHLDELIILENSGNLNAENIEDYIALVTENLGYLRASSKLSLLCKNPAKTLAHIAEVACSNYRYVIFDVGYNYTNYLNKLIDCSELVIHCLTQDQKTILKTAETYTRTNFCEGKFVVPIICRYDDNIPVSDREIGRKLKTNDIFTLHRSANVYSAGLQRDITGYVAKHIEEKPSLFGFMRKKTDEELTSLPVVELAAVCDLINTAFEEQKQQEELAKKMESEG